MDIATRLQLMLEVIEQGSFAKAAELRNIDRSVISKQIRKLEDELGVRLLNRSTRSLSLTSVGVEITRQARSLRDILNETHKLAEDYHSSPKGMLRITSTTMFGRLYAHQAIENFLTKYPEVDIELRLDDRRVDVVGERYDLAFRIGPPRDSDLIARKLADSHLAILASNDFIKKHGHPETIEQLCNLPAVIYSGDNFTADKIDIIDNKGKVKTYQMNGKYRVNESETIVDAVKSGIGYAKVGTFMLSENIKKIGLVPLMTDLKLYSQCGIHIMYPHRNIPIKTELFINEIRSVVGTPPIWHSYIDDYEKLYL